MPAPNAKHGKYSALFSKNKKTATENLGGCIMKIVLWISRGKCRVGLWCVIIIIIRKTASTFHNGLTANTKIWFLTLRITAISLPAIQVLLMLLYNGVFTDFKVSIHSIVFISIDIVHHLSFRFVASLYSHL